MDYIENISGDSARVALKGKFTFNDHDKFRGVIDMVKENGLRMLALDFDGVEFIDSAGLGMLLVAREEGKKHGTDVVLCNAKGQAEKMFRVSKFETLFNMQ